MLMTDFAFVEACLSNAILLKGQPLLPHPGWYFILDMYIDANCYDLGVATTILHPLLCCYAQACICYDFSRKTCFFHKCWSKIVICCISGLTLGTFDDLSGNKPLLSLDFTHTWHKIQKNTYILRLHIMSRESDFGISALCYSLEFWKVGICAIQPKLLFYLASTKMR